MPSSSPQISRPSGPSPNIACWKRIWAYSAGSSRYERISSTMTARSWSISWSAQHRPDDELRDHVDRALRLADRDPDPVDGRLAIRRGVEAAADALDGLGDGARRRVRRGALEGDVLHEMGNAGLARRLESRAGQDVRGDRDRTRSGQAGADDARPVWQRGSFEHRPDGTGTTGPHPGGRPFRWCCEDRRRGGLMTYLGRMPGSQAWRK